MASSWDRGPKEHSGEIGEASNSNLTEVRRGVSDTKKGQGEGVYSLAWDLRATQAVTTEQERLALTFRKIKFGLQMDSSIKPSLTTLKLSSRGSCGALAYGGLSSGSPGILEKSQAEWPLGLVRAQQAVTHTLSTPGMMLAAGHQEAG